MSALHAEKTLLAHLTWTPSVESIVAEGFDPEQMPTAPLRPVYDWAIDYFDGSGGQQAPSVQVMRDRWGDLLDDHEVEVEYEPSDSIDWAVTTLRANHLHAESQRFVKAFATEMGEAPPEDREEILDRFASELVALSMSVQRAESHAEMREAMAGRMRAYERRRDSDVTAGMTFGLPMVDEHTLGIQPGEAAMLAAGPKTGKSFMLALMAYREWEAGRPSILFTLENSVPMTLDRLACLASHVNPTSFQRGTCHEVEEQRVRRTIAEMEASDTPLWIVQPDANARTVESMVREAIVRGASSLFIDQLTFIDAPNPRDPRHYQIRAILHSLKVAISTGVTRLPCMLAHQINREGVRNSRKYGRLEMEDLAEGSEAERTMDFVFGLFRSEMDVQASLAKLQMLAARRAPLANWELDWSIEVGNFAVRQQIDLSRSTT